MSLLKTAVKARIPLIAARTDDPSGFRFVVEALTGSEVRPVTLLSSSQSNGGGLKPPKPSISQVLTPGQVGVMEYQEVDWRATQDWLTKNNAVLIVMNPTEVDFRMLDVGFISVPTSLIEEFVKEHTDDPPANFVSALSGLSLQNIERVSKMAMAEFGEFTPTSLRAIRKQLFPVVRGIEEVATEQLFYDPSERLTEWLGFEGRLFKLGTPYLLTPRGFLFKGAPGTGKTSGAKYLAHQLKVPLYRLDIGQVLSKWAGESDQRLSTALKQAESFEPCVLLIDEVEKLFEVSNGDIVSRLLGHLLWWLQEHTSKVLTVMTTNHIDKIPPELYREGRIDETVEITGLTNANVLFFMRELANKLSHIAVVPTEDLEALMVKMKGPYVNPTFVQSRVSEQVLRLIKLKIVHQMKGESSEC